MNITPERSIDSFNLNWYPSLRSMMIMACDFCWEENPSVLLMSPPFLHPGTWSSPCAPAQPAAWPTWASSHLTFWHDCIYKCYVGHISCCKHIYNTHSLFFGQTEVVSYKWHVVSSGPKHQHPLESFHFSRLPNQKVWKSVLKKHKTFSNPHDSWWPEFYHLFTWKNRYNLCSPPVALELVVERHSVPNPYLFGANVGGAFSFFWGQPSKKKPNKTQLHLDAGL